MSSLMDRLTLTCTAFLSLCFYMYMMDFSYNNYDDCSFICSTCPKTSCFSLVAIVRVMAQS